MSQFKDNAGTTWHLVVDGFVLDTLHQRYGLDFNDLPAIWSRIMSPSEIWKVIAAMTEEEREAQSPRVTERMLASRLTGEALPRAQQALEDALRFFFPAPQWSTITSALQQRQALEDQVRKAEPVRMALEKLPEALQTKLLAAVMETAKTKGVDGASQLLLAKLSPSNAATESAPPGSAGADKPAPDFEGE